MTAGTTSKVVRANLPLGTIRCLAAACLAIGYAVSLQAQSSASSTGAYVTVKAGKCLIVFPADAEAKNPGGRHDWNGACINGLASDAGLHRGYDAAGKLIFIKRAEFRQGRESQLIEGYSGAGPGRIFHIRPGDRKSVV